MKLRTRTYNENGVRRRWRWSNLGDFLAHLTRRGTARAVWLHTNRWGEVVSVCVGECGCSREVEERRAA
jgi:hypothetical protein